MVLTTQATSGRGPTSSRTRQITAQGGHAREVPTLSHVLCTKPSTVRRLGYTEGCCHQAPGQHRPPSRRSSRGPRELIHVNSAGLPPLPGRPRPHCRATRPGVGRGHRGRARRRRAADGRRPGRTEAWRSHAAKYLCQWALPISSVGTLFSCIGPGMMGGRECGRWDEHGELLPAGSGELAERGYRATSERTYGWETSAHGRLSGESAMGRGCQAVQRRAFFTFGTKS